VIHPTEIPAKTSYEINVQISQFAAEFVKNFRSFMGDDPRVPDVVLQSYGYMYLADTEEFADTLRENQKIQSDLGAGTKFMTADEIKRDYPFYHLDDIIGANHNLIDEGYFDGNTLFDWWKRSAREKGVEYVTNEVVAITRNTSGIHFRTDGQYYLAGCPPDEDPAVDHDDFTQDHSIWEEKVWPAIATRIPQFEAIKLINSWAGHYAFNTLDQNAIVGPHSTIENFFFVNGFSGHGFQQSPAMGRGISEWITYGAYRSLDLSPFSFTRIERGEPFLEKAVI